MLSQKRKSINSEPLYLQMIGNVRLLTAVVIYMSFSVIMSIIWALLQAPDLSITEAAVGAGVTSILYFVTLEKLKGIEEVLKQDGTI